MKQLTSLIKKLLLIIFIFTIIASVIDYLRITSNKLPIFTKVEYNNVTKTQYFKSIAYTLERTITISQDETLSLSEDIKYKIFFKEIYIKIKEEKIDKTYLILKTKDNCKEDSELYYYNPETKQKVYTYCLSSIKLKESKNEELNQSLKKSPEILETIFGKLTYEKTDSKNYNQFYNDNFFKEYTGTGITAIKCKNNDIYFAEENIKIPNDFCTDKKDTFKYHFEIVDESNELTCPEQTPTCETQPETCIELEEVFYEDKNNKYILNCKKSHLISLITKTETGEIDQKYSLKDALNQQIVTIDDLKNKGLEFEKQKTISKNQEQNKK